MSKHTSSQKENIPKLSDSNKGDDQFEDRLRRFREVAQKCPTIPLNQNADEVSKMKDHIHKFLSQRKCFFLFQQEVEPLRDRQLHTERRAAERPNAIKSEMKRREFETMWSKSKSKLQKAPFRSPSAKKGKLPQVAERSRSVQFDTPGIHTSKRVYQKTPFPKNQEKNLEDE